MEILILQKESLEMSFVIRNLCQQDGIFLVGVIVINLPILVPMSYMECAVDYLSLKLIVTTSTLIGLNLMFLDGVIGLIRK